EVNGFTVVPSGKYLKIVESTNIEQQTIPLYEDGSTTPASDRYVTRIHHLENVSAEDVTNLLGRFKSASGSITTYGPTNMLIITDTGAQIRRMLRLVSVIDLPRSGTQTWIEPIHYANASELAARLLEIFPAETAGTQPNAAAARAVPKVGTANQPALVGEVAAESTIRNIIADERTNSLIIIATERAYMRILEMIRQLDVALEGEGRIHVHYVQHGAASDIAGALTALVGASSPGATANATGPRGGQAQRTARPTNVTGTLFEGAIAVTAYEPANALVITSSLHDFTSLKKVIDRLDAPRKQVFIEAVVMELGVERTSDLGFSFHGGAGNFPTDGSLSLFGFNAPSSIDITQNNLTGLALGVRGPTIENSQQLVGFSVPGFGVVVTALASSGDADVLSTPHIIAIDNTEAEISVGENIPLQTNGVAPGTFAGLGALGSTATGGAAAGGLGGLGGLGSVARQDVGTTIRVTPHINANNEVRLEIEEEISEQGATSGTLGVVSINRRTARTEVMIRDQQTIVIGGLMRDAISNKEDKVPVLGDIPILGALFRKTSKKKRKTNLLLILTPYIIRDPGDLREIFERKMQERQQMIDRYFVFGEDKFEPHIDYSRTRGLVAEIVNEIDGVEAEILLAKAAELAPVPDHVPRTPIGSYRAPETKAEETVVIGPNGVEPMETEEPSSTEQVPPTAADEQEGGGAPPPPINLETPAEPETPIEPEENAVPKGPDEVIEPDEPESGPAEAAPAEEPGGVPAATEPEEPSPPSNQEGQDAPQ
ncbi:MAG: type II secretion system secretin GspD, partial [Polyangiales bacterium]